MTWDVGDVHVCLSESTGHTYVDMSDARPVHHQLYGYVTTCRALVSIDQY